MRMTMASPLLLAHAAALFACAPALADSLSLKEGGGARSVAELLQRREEARLHAQLQREGRTEELLDLDESIARRAQVRREQAAAQLNVQIAGTSARKAALPFDECEVTARIR